MKILKNRLVIGMICIILAVAIGFFAVPVLVSVTNQKVPVIVAADNIAAGTKITEDMLRTFEMFSSDIPSGADLKYSEVVGQYALIDIMESDVMFRGKFTSEFPYEDEVLYNIPVGQYAVAVTVDNLAENVAGKIRPGDVVTLLVSVQGQRTPDEIHPAETFPELMYMEVLSATTSEGSDLVRQEKTELNTENKEELPSVITLLCNLEQAKMLAGFENGDKIHLALTARSGSALAEEYLFRQQELFIKREEARVEEEARLAAEEQDALAEEDFLDISDVENLEDAEDTLVVLSPGETGEEGEEVPPDSTETP